MRIVKLNTVITITGDKSMEFNAIGTVNELNLKKGRVNLHTRAKHSSIICYLKAVKNIYSFLFKNIG